MHLNAERCENDVGEVGENRGNTLFSVLPTFFSTVFDACGYPTNRIINAGEYMRRYDWEIGGWVMIAMMLVAVVMAVISVVRDIAALVGMMF